MLVLRNAEGSKFNANVDNYLVISLENQKLEDLNQGQLEWLVEVTEGFHSETLVIEAQSDLSDVIDFLIDIDKLICFNRSKISKGVYYTVQRNILDDLN
jgi:hypothetical protein